MFQEFEMGSKVPSSGKYKCGVCGDTWDLEAGEEFPECEACYDSNATWQAIEEEGAEME